jgi:hypothetical protein
MLVIMFFFLFQFYNVNLYFKNDNKVSFNFKPIEKKIDFNDLDKLIINSSNINNYLAKEFEVVNDIGTSNIELLKIIGRGSYGWVY